MLIYFLQKEFQTLSGCLAISQIKCMKRFIFHQNILN